MSTNLTKALDSSSISESLAELRGFLGALEALNTRGNHVAGYRCYWLRPRQKNLMKAVADLIWAKKRWRIALHERPDWRTHLATVLHKWCFDVLPSLTWLQNWERETRTAGIVEYCSKHLDQIVGDDLLGAYMVRVDSKGERPYHGTDELAFDLRRGFLLLSFSWTD